MPHALAPSSPAILQSPTPEVLFLSLPASVLIFIVVLRAPAQLQGRSKTHARQSGWAQAQRLEQKVLGVARALVNLLDAGAIAWRAPGACRPFASCAPSCPHRAG